ncbi:hypothetical protein Tco_1526075 [Tanacetum coccineum]
MASMKYCVKHNKVGFLKKPKESIWFAEIVDFLKELRATIDTLEYIITEVSVRCKLQLADALGISMLPNTEIFEGMGNMGYPADGQADQVVDQPSSINQRFLRLLHKAKLQGRKISALQPWKPAKTLSKGMLSEVKVHCLIRLAKEEEALIEATKEKKSSKFNLKLNLYMKRLGCYKAKRRAKVKRNKAHDSVTIKNLHVKLSDESRNLEASQLKKLTTKAQLKRYKKSFQTKFQRNQGLMIKMISDTEEKVVKSERRRASKKIRKRKQQKARKSKLEIFQQGKRTFIQIIRANGVDTVYISFGAMLKDFTREDLIELYRLVMHKYGTNRPGDAYDRVL